VEFPHAVVKQIIKRIQKLLPKYRILPMKGMRVLVLTKGGTSVLRDDIAGMPTSFKKPCFYGNLENLVIYDECKKVELTLSEINSLHIIRTFES
jgi:hypothetical protein